MTNEETYWIPDPQSGTSATAWFPVAEVPGLLIRRFWSGQATKLYPVGYSFQVATSNHITLAWRKDRQEAIDVGASVVGD